MPPKATTSTAENVFGLRPNEIRLLLQGLAFVGSDGKPDFEKMATENGVSKASTATMYSRARRRLETIVAGDNKADAPDAEGDQPQTPTSTKKRGRKPKAKASAESGQGDAEESEASPSKPAPKRRGRKPKVAAAEEPRDEGQDDTNAPEPVAKDQDHDVPVNDPADEEAV